MGVPPFGAPPEPPPLIELREQLGQANKLLNESAANLNPTNLQRLKAELDNIKTEIENLSELAKTTKIDDRAELISNGITKLLTSMRTQLNSNIEIRTIEPLSLAKQITTLNALKVGDLPAFKEDNERNRQNKNSNIYNYYEANRNASELILGKVRANENSRSKREPERFQISTVERDAALANLAEMKKVYNDLKTIYDDVISKMSPEDQTAFLNDRALNGDQLERIGGPNNVTTLSVMKNQLQYMERQLKTVNEDEVRLNSLRVNAPNVEAELKQKEVQEKQAAAQARETAANQKATDAREYPGIWQKAITGGRENYDYIVQFMSRNRELINATDKDGNTILHHVLQNITPEKNAANSLPVVANLIIQGANPVQKNNQGQTPLSLLGQNPDQGFVDQQVKDIRTQLNDRPSSKETDGIIVEVFEWNNKRQAEQNRDAGMEREAIARPADSRPLAPKAQQLPITPAQRSSGTTGILQSLKEKFLPGSSSPPRKKVSDFVLKGHTEGPSVKRTNSLPDAQANRAIEDYKSNHNQVTDKNAILRQFKLIRMASLSNLFYVYTNQMEKIKAPDAIVAYKTSLNNIIPIAQQTSGNPAIIGQAQYQLSRALSYMSNNQYYTDKEKEQYKATAADWLLKAKDNGDPRAMYEVAMVLAKKGNIEQKYEAQELFNKIFDTRPQGNKAYPSFDQDLQEIKAKTAKFCAANKKTLPNDDELNAKLKAFKEGKKPSSSLLSDMHEESPPPSPRKH